MKGLLQKDFYCIVSYMKMFLILNVFYIISGLVNDVTNISMLLYPCIFSSIMSYSMLAYEEQEKWNSFALTMPLSRNQIVSSKYIITLILGICTAVLIVITRIIGTVVSGTFTFEYIIFIASLLIAICLLPAAIILPFMFKFGATKGRIAYILVFGVFSSFIFTGMKNINGTNEFTFDSLSAVVIVPTAILIFSISWFISCIVYRKREF